MTWFSNAYQVNEVIGTVYQYLKLLREVGPQAWVFEELRDISNMEFKYSEEQPQDDYAVELAGFFSLKHKMFFVIFFINK